MCRYRVWRAANPNNLYADFARSADGGQGKHTFRENGTTLINACNRGQVDVVCSSPSNIKEDLI